MAADVTAGLCTGAALAYLSPLLAGCVREEAVVAPSATRGVVEEGGGARAEKGPPGEKRAARAQGDAEETATVHVRPGVYFSWSAPGTGGWGGDLNRMQDLVKKHPRTVLQIDARSNPEMLVRLIDTFKASHGFWQTITLAERDPDERFRKYEAAIELDKQEYSTDEPILLTLRISPDAPWWLLNPKNIRIQDARGKDVNTFMYPANGGDGHTRSKVWYNLSVKTIDLTSFAEPYYGIEYVHRFSPGSYAARFYFVVEYPHQDDCFDTEDTVYPRVWGERHSNTVHFTVRPAVGSSSVDVRQLFKTASEMVEKDRANEAVDVYKKIVLGAVDLPTIRKAIQQILLIRSCAAWDDAGNGKSLSEGIKKLWEDTRGWGTRWPEPVALRLSLLHLPRDERKDWCKRYVRLRLGQFDSEDEEEREGKVFEDVDFRSLFHYPQFKSILEEELERPEQSPLVFVEVYLGLPGEKDPDIMRGLLGRHPSAVLEHYCRHKAPIELVPLLADYFDDEKLIWGNGPVRWYRMDSALLAFEKAVGLDLGYGDLRHWNDKVARVEGRRLIKDVLRQWWQRHRQEYGVTEGASDEMISARLAALRKADEVWEGRIEGVDAVEGGELIRFDKRRTIKGSFPGGGSRIFVREDVVVPEALREDARVVICVSRNPSKKRRYEFELDMPRAIWPAER